MDLPVDASLRKAVNVLLSVYEDGELVGGRLVDGKEVFCAADGKEGDVLACFITQKSRNFDSEIMKCAPECKTFEEALGVGMDKLMEDIKSYAATGKELPTNALHKFLQFVLEVISADHPEKRIVKEFAHGEGDSLIKAVFETKADVQKLLKSRSFATKRAV